MKKRLLSALLALALVFVLLPTTALADTTSVTDENVKINGTPVTVGNGISLGEGNGTYSYDKATHTLTLNSATITTTGNIGISFGVPVKRNIDYKIELIGTNTISSTSAQAIYVEYDSDLDQQGTQKLSTLTINGSAGSQLILNASGYEKEAIWSKGDFTLSGGTAVTAFSSGEIAVNVGSMTINNSKLSAQSSSYGTTVVLYGFEMIGDAAEFEALNTSSGVRAVLRTSGASENIDWSKYQLITGSYSGNALTKSEPTVCDKNTLNELFSSSSTTRYIHIAKRTIPALETTSDVYIAGGPAVVGQWTNIPAAATGTGSYYYDADKKELTLKDVNITHSDGAIVQFMAGAPYIIKLEGTNSIKDVNSFIRVPERGYESLDGLSVTISGAGSLEVIARGNAITMLKGNLIFNNTGAIALETTTINGKAINVSGDISIGDDFNKNLRITADNGDMTFDPTNQYTDYNDLKNYKSITIASKPSETYYNGTAMKYGETRPAGSGTISCDENGAITLNGATAGTLEFRSSADSTLVLEGTNTLSSIVTTQKGLTISGSGSLTVGSIRVPNNTKHTADLTITGGAHVTVNRPSEDKPAVEVSGNLTVTGDGTQLSAECTAATNPAIEVGGNASFTGSTVTITNHSTALHKDAADATKGDSVSSALYVKGNINTDNANVTAKVENGGGNAIGALGNITVKGSSNVTAVNKGQKFTTIIAENVYVSGDSTITANNLNKNPPYKDSYLAFPAIEGKIVNQNTDYSLKFEGKHSRTSGPKTTLAPGEQTTLYYYNVTITRGDEVTRTPSPVVIAGTTLLNDTYYTINGSKVAEGTDSNNYNAFYDSETKTLKLNNASINGAGSNKAIEANVGGNTLTIELVGNNIIKTSGFANNVIDITGNLYFTGSGTAEVSGKGTPIYATYKIDVSADVTITNTEKAGSFTFSAYGENSSNYKGANTFAIGAGYTAYATTDKTTWAVYDNTTASENENYTTLRVTKENLAPTTPTPQTPFTIYGIPAQFVDGGMIATTGVTATSSNNINLPIDRVEWYTFTPGFRPDGSMDSVINKTKATGNFEAGKYYVVEIRFVQDLSPFESWDMKVSGWSDNDVSRQSETARNDIEIYFLTPASAATHEHNWVEKYDTVYHWKMCTYDGCTAIKDKAPHEWVGWKIDEPSQGMHNRFCNCGYNDYSHHYNLVYAAAGEAGHYQYCTLGNCTFKTSTVPHNYDGDTCTICNYTKSGEIVPPTPDNPGTIVIIRPAEEEKPAQQPNPSTGANDLVGLAVAAAVAAALGSAALLRKHD